MFKIYVNLTYFDHCKDLGSIYIYIYMIEFYLAHKFVKPAVVRELNDTFSVKDTYIIYDKK